ncbi:CenpB-DNA-bind-domain-containing protein [Phanerochaete sordida]|uniref:CenpB-DNA-bind-domain-containing protein n=1 Tax=Phanerochaete sordida TaxID=48140 RepID=A0A9P3LAG8_9APHY|nr:CenpB-DNA-bind-domain-containing protein [Phanerochaete sordida]
MRENSPRMMGMQVGQEQARPRDRVLSDEGYGSHEHEQVEFDSPSREPTPLVDPNEEPIDFAAQSHERERLRLRAQGRADATSNGQHRYNPYGASAHRRYSSSDQRSASPANSSISNDTSHSSLVRSSLPHNMRLGAPARTKHRKQRLYTVDRRAICEMAQKSPHLRQEDIAREFSIERSTVSKILKEKERWLATPANPQVRVSKYRLAKYPQLEAELKSWIVSENENGVIFTDAMIRNKAKELGEKWRDETEGKFKASPGWIENFKARVGIRKGRYTGNGTDEQKAKAHGLSPGWNGWPSQPQPMPTTSATSPADEVVSPETSPPMSQPVDEHTDSAVWPQQQTVGTWSEQQAYGVAEPTVASAYHAPQATDHGHDAPPVYDSPQGHQDPSASYATSAVGGDSGIGGDGGQFEEWPDKTDIQHALGIIEKVFKKPAFNSQITDQGMDGWWEVSRFLQTFIA